MRKTCLVLTGPYHYGGPDMEQKNKEQITISKQNAAQKQSYKIGKIRFIVQPVFKEKDSDTLSAILWRLMRSEMEP